MIETLRKYEIDNKIYSQKHPTLPLLIWNYTKNTAYNNLWDEVTIICRALVTDLDGNIIARSFPKFWNLEEDKHIASENYSVYQKYDGSLGLLFYYNNSWIFTSRGSFNSDQAIKGKEILDSRYSKCLDSLDKSYTYSFEIIYPENQVVLSYGFEDLILLAAINSEGKELDIKTISGFTTAEQFEVQDYSTLSSKILDNQEGFIVHFDNGQRIKIKGENYKRIHTLMSEISTTSIWECLKNNDPIELLVKELPDESYSKVQEYVKVLTNKFKIKKNYYISEYSKLPQVESNKDFADSITTSNLKHIFFRLRSSKDIDEIIWKEIKPEFKRIGGLDTTKAITLLVGISGSGKSTWANAQWKLDPLNTVVISRDKIRELISGFDESTIHLWYDLPNRSQLEKEVTKYEMTLIHESLASNKHIILDATHLEFKYIDNLRYWNVPINIKWMECPLEVAIARDSMRTRKVGETIIKSQLKLLHKLKQDYNWFNTVTKFENDKNKPSCYILDIDGTIADNEGRSPFEWDKVIQDKPIQWVIDTANKLDNVIICTGRDGVCLQETKDWLDKHGVKYSKIYTRDIGNSEPDWIVKERMWKEIAEDFYIKGLFDDRTVVVRRARALGLNVMECIYHNF